MSATSKQPRIVIIGGGFAGMAAAKALRKAPANVLIIDRHNYHLFQPLLYQVATGGLNPADIAYPIRRIVRSYKNTEVMLGEVTAVDSQEQIVTIDSDTKVTFDYLIMAAGLENFYFGNAWQDVAPGLKGIGDALEIRRRVYKAFERAESIAIDAELRGETWDVSDYLTFVVIGGGPTGVELAGALVEIGLKTLHKDFDHIDPKKIRVLLVEGQDRLLPTFPAKVSRKTKDKLQTLGVEVVLESRVTTIDDSGVTVADHKIAAKTVLWAAGVRGVELADSVTAQKSRRVKVKDDLSLPESERVFVVGDMAIMESDNVEVPAMAQGATQSGRHAARNIVADLKGKQRKSFSYKDKGSMAAIGRNAAAVSTKRVKSVGFTAWIIWWLAHIFFIVGYRNRIFVFISWIWSYVTFQKGARLVTEGANVSKRPQGGVASRHSDNPAKDVSA